MASSRDALRPSTLKYAECSPSVTTIREIDGPDLRERDVGERVVKDDRALERAVQLVGVRLGEEANKRRRTRLLFKKEAKQLRT